MNRATIILADDHQHIATQLRYLLGETFEVVAVVGDGQALVKAAARLHPDMVVTDISMPGMDGIQAAREMLTRQPMLRIVFITVHEDIALARIAMEVGQGYVVKASAGDELVEAVNAVLNGGRFVSASLGPLDDSF
ncbi:response regulator transcription factor [Rhodanobacter sp. MP7CTX1]|uniref:response regulator n=1 Tax=Rhodanobacter sp. MP7CTX1 TaxID=2723084 RepID=UPI00160DA5A2|nr:DNA-binding NarL/FixJ family response regulator [Rhodanobacter sp. MP7CTX1]